MVYLPLKVEQRQQQQQNSLERRSHRNTMTSMVKPFERIDTPILDNVEKGSSLEYCFSDISLGDDNDDNDNYSMMKQNFNSLEEGSASNGSMDSTLKHRKNQKATKDHMDIEKYMSRREMTPLQERVNAITVIPGAFYCLLFLLSGSWLDQSRKEQIIGDELMVMDSNSNYNNKNNNINNTSGESGCISSAWFPNLHALPPLPVVAVAGGIILHFPFSFLYHWHYAHRLPPGSARTTHWSRRLDQAMIHFASALFTYATSGRLDYFMINLLYNVDCMFRLFRPRVYPRRNQFRIFLSAVAYTIPIVRHGEWLLFLELWLVLGFSAWLFITYPIGGWSHSAFHLAMAFAPPLLMTAALHLPTSHNQLMVAARCAFYEKQLLDSPP